MNFQLKPLQARLVWILPATAALLAACGGGGDAGSNASAQSGQADNRAHALGMVAGTGFDTTGMMVTPPSNLDSVVPQFNPLRTVYVDASNAAASDTTGDGSEAKPFKTISRATRSTQLKPGDKIVIGPGTYREQIDIPAWTRDQWGANTTTALVAKTPGTVVIKGSDVVGGWQQVDSTTWTLPWASEPEQVYRKGVSLQQVGGTVFGGYPNTPIPGISNPWPGRVTDTSKLTDWFTYDPQNGGRIVLHLSTPLTAGETLEVSKRTYVLNATSVNGLLLDGLVFEHANTSLKARHGAVYVTGTRNLIRNTTVRQMDSFCAMISSLSTPELPEPSAIVYSTLDHCGQAGLSASGRDMSVAANRVLSNNTRGFNINWEAGGMKITGGLVFTHSSVRYNLAANNWGDGIWFDWTPTDVLIEKNTSAQNTGNGIHFEAADHGTITGNYTYGNGRRGIYLLESQYNVVSDNVSFANDFEGVGVANGTRSATYPDLLPYGNQVIHNTLVWNDRARNRAQLLLPGWEFGAQSDRNWFKATDNQARFVMQADTVDFYKGLAAWQVRSGLDGASYEQAASAMTPAVANAVASADRPRPLLSLGDLPTFLQSANH